MQSTLTQIRVRPLDLCCWTDDRAEIRAWKNAGSGQASGNPQDDAF